MSFTLSGHEVVVFERRGSIAAESSFALSGLCAACLPVPWSVPGVRRRASARWWVPNPSIRLGAWYKPSAWPWLLSHWQAMRPPARNTGAAAVHALAVASRIRLGHIAHSQALAFEQRDGGMLLLRSPAQVDSVRLAIAAAAGARGAFELIDAETCRTLEPGLNPQGPVLGGVRLPAAVVGNARQFAHQLKAAAQRQGAKRSH